MKSFATNEYTYSIIIPHKNTPVLLHRCLKSIPRRKDVQILVVDDNSDVAKVDFEKFPGLGEPCVEVYFTKEGKGAGYARNIGLQHAKGKWLLFADADDLFCVNFLSNIDLFAETEYDVIYFKTIDQNGTTLIPIEFRALVDMNRAETYNAILTHDSIYISLFHIVPWSKMIQRKLIEESNISFDEIRYSNDVMFFTKLSFIVKSIYVSQHYLYCVTKPTIDNLTKNREFVSGKMRLQVLLERNEYIQKRGVSRLLIPPLVFVWQYRGVGITNILIFISIIIKSTTPLFTGMSKFLRTPLVYLKNNK